MHYHIISNINFNEKVYHIQKIDCYILFGKCTIEINWLHHNNKLSKKVTKSFFPLK